MFAALLTAAPAFLLRFLGEGLVGEWLGHKRAQAETAAGREKTRLDHEIRLGEHELRRRDQQRDIQIKEMEHPYLWWPKFLMTMAVCGYWAARFAVKTFGLDEFGVAVSALSTEEAAVSSIVVSALYLPAAVRRIRGE
jgi:hypothetical protein